MDRKITEIVDDLESALWKLWGGCRVDYERIEANKKGREKSGRISKKISEEFDKMKQNVDAFYKEMNKAEVSEAEATPS